MMESNREKLARVRQMAVDKGTWDLSENDQAALVYVLDRFDALEEAIFQASITDIAVARLFGKVMDADAQQRLGV